MDVLSIIKDEHRKVSQLLDEAANCQPGDDRLRELAGEIQTELTTHLAVEERLFYGQLRKRAEEQEEEVEMFEAYVEHDAARHLLDLVTSGRKPDERFKAELVVLGENVKHHVQEEESKVFAIAKNVMEADELEEIGEAWQRAKARAAKRAERR